jgi:quercetin dioxygenase-like cupin family protein
MSSREAASQYVPIVDNPRMRAWRLILEPGVSTPAISQAGKGVRIVVRGGLLTTTTPGAPDQTLALRPGDFAVQKAGLVRALRNAGTETIELVEMELK